MATAGSRRSATTSRSSPPAGSSAWWRWRPATRARRACPALVTVIYNTPKDAAAFESYYSATHLPLVGVGQQEIGFDAGRPHQVRRPTSTARRRPSTARRSLLPVDGRAQEGHGHAGVQEGGRRPPQFATGGLAALIGEQQ